MSLGLTLAKAFEGAALGTLSAAEERDKKIEAEKTKRDVLFQQARRDVKEDIGKYNQAKESARKRFDLATAELSTMIGDSDERRVVAANMAKQFLDTGSLQKALDNYSTNIGQGDTPFEGLDFANVNMEAFKNMSDTDVAAALVSPSLLPKGIDSHYKPSAFTEDSILFGGSGQPQALKAQQEQYASLAKASGLNITTPEGEIPLVSLAAPVPLLSIENSTEALSKARARYDRVKKDPDKYGGDEGIKEAERQLSIAKSRYAADKAAGRINNNKTGKMSYSIDNMDAQVRRNVKGAVEFFAYENSDTKKLMGIGGNVAGPITQKIAERETIFRIYVSGQNQEDVDDRKRTLGWSTKLRGVKLDVLENAKRIRGNNITNLTEFLDGVRNNLKTDKDSDEYKSLLPAQKDLINKLNSEKETKVAKAAFANSLHAYLVDGFFFDPETLRNNEKATTDFRAFLNSFYS